MGGGEQHVLTLLEGFQGQNVTVRLVLFSHGKLEQAARDLGVETHVFPKRFRGDLEPLIRLTRFIRDKRIDIVHTHLISGNLYGRIAGRLAGVQGLVSTVHHSRKDAVGNFAIPFMQEMFFHGDNLMGLMSDRLITPSEDLKQLLMNYRVPHSKIFSIPNAINNAKTQCSPNNIIRCRRALGISAEFKIVGMVGRLVPVKNFELYIQAAKEVIEQGVRAKFLIIGDGPLRAKLEDLTRALNMQEHIVFTGFRDDVFILVALMDLFVLCSKSETNPIALMEAMASGKPVIATDVGGVSELITHGRDGWLCPSNDTLSLSRSIKFLLQQTDRAGALGDAARQKINKTYALNKVTGQLLSVYKQMVKTT